AAQLVIGNVLEPRMMGKSLNLSSLVVIVSLAVWGSIWGVTGMFLSVPITVVLMIVLAEFKQTRPIAILLSADGKV
ncbi:MAG: AI-2E family transporter, partial [Alphaproteobacteria bacterium]|nr:AI-2E family transporter [Alphaproteobacteria bacterium]